MLSMSCSVRATAPRGLCPLANTHTSLRSGKACLLSVQALNLPSGAREAHVDAEHHVVSTPAQQLEAQQASFVLPSWVKTALTFLGAAVLGVVLMLGSPSAAEAARSGGRVGGSSFGSRGSSSSYGGGGGMRSSGPGLSSGLGYGGSGYSSGQSFSRPGGGVIVRPPVVVSPSYGFGYPMFGYGVPMGYGGGSSLFTLLVLGVFAYVAFQTFTSSGGDDEDYDDMAAEPMSVVKLQVGLLGSARGLQKDLDRMAHNTDTSTPQGLHYLLQETVLALRRNPQYACYGKASLIKARGLDNAEAKFNEVSMEERGKFESETLSNYGGRKSRAMSTSRADGMNELIVVTIIAAVDGKLEPVDVTSVDDLKTDLALLGSIPSNRLLALEVLWTPQDDNDYFTKEQLIEDYPTLNTI